MTVDGFKLFLKNKKILLLSIVACSLFVLSLWLLVEYFALSIVRDNQIMQARVDTLVKYKTLKGDTAYRIREKLVVEKDLKERDSIAKELLIAKSEINRLVKITTEADYSRVKTRVTDTIYKDKDGRDQIRKYAAFDDGYVSIAATMDDTLRFSKLQTRDTLAGVFSKKKVGKDVINYLTVTNKSPYGKVTGLENISYKEEPKYSRWSLGGHAGYDFIIKQPVFSVGINYDLIRFKK